MPVNKICFLFSSVSFFFATLRCDEQKCDFRLSMTVMKQQISIQRALVKIDWSGCMIHAPRGIKWSVERFHDENVLSSLVYRYSGHRFIFPLFNQGHGWEKKYHSDSSRKLANTFTRRSTQSPSFLSAALFSSWTLLSFDVEECWRLAVCNV